MSILIKGMKMPQTCTMCWFSPICPVWVKEVSRYKGYDNRLPNCPLVEVPTPHGRLIDADKLHKVMYHRAFETDGDTMWQSGCWVRYRAIEQVQDSQPTIIEAEGQEK